MNNSDYSIQSWGGYVQRALADAGEPRASDNTLSHYYLRGATPSECVDAVKTARKPVFVEDAP